MKPAKNIFFRLLTVILAVLTPLVIIMTSVRLLMTPAFLVAEYHMPGFPDDPYGFTMQERLKWSKISITYLLNNSDISYFNSYKLDSGDPLYNDRELSHMDDVKVVVTNGRLFWLGTLVVWIAILLFLYLKNSLAGVKKALNLGGWLTIGLMGLMGVTILLSFDALFTQFHNLFFESGTWTFYYSDTFIRLFPLRFWQDAFILIAVLSVIFSLVLIYAGQNKRS